ncbi:hypothetical protein [Atopobacter phocae]|uniref:hypothetical protein n=1 Tax=Atopobacter phocae TaxID=136492 RepID=UPI00046EA520|nr:hypothetical protein [Atopobacter phocae]
MKELSTLKESVLSSATAEAKSHFELKQKEIMQHLTHEKEKIAKNAMDEQQTIRQNQQVYIERMKQRLDNDRSKDLLRHKQSLLDGVFDGAYEAMTNWSFETVKQFLKDVVESLPEKNYQLVLGRLTSERLNHEEKEQLVAQLPNLQLSEETLPNEAGFIIRDEIVNYNYLYRDLIKDMQKDFGTTLAREVFQK